MRACLLDSQAIIAAASLNEDGKARKVIVTGCLAQRYNTQLAEDLPEVDLVLGFENYGNLVQNLDVSLGLPGATQRAFATMGGEEATTSTPVEGNGSSLPGYQHQGTNFTTSGISRVQVSTRIQCNSTSCFVVLCSHSKNALQLCSRMSLSNIKPRL